MWEPTSIVWLLCQKLHLPGKFMCQENLCIFGTCLRIDLLHTCMYEQEKKCEPLGTSYTTKSSILNKKNDHCVTIFRLEAFGAVVSPKLPHYLMKERDKGPESYTPVCHHLKQKCKFRDAIIMSNNSFVNFRNLKNHLNGTNESALFFLFKCL